MTAERLSASSPHYERDDTRIDTYDFKIQTPAGDVVTIPMAEWNTFRDGKLASARLIFDTAALDTALAPA